MNRYSLALFITIFIHLNNFAQSTFEFGMLPSFNLNKSLPKDWSLNFKAESRQSLMKEDFRYDYLLTDLSVAASKKIGINTSIAMGYLMRVDEKGIRNRAIQQLTFVKRHRYFRLSHRLSADQTFIKNDDTEFRLRYRVSAEIPLEGQSLDPKEFFLKISNEYLNSLHDKSYDLEIRASAYLGYVLFPNDKLEFGIDNRLDSFINSNSRNRLWIGLNYYKSI